MKQFAIVTLMLLSGTAWAHGSIPQQANDAVTAAVKFMQSSEPRADLRLFKSIQADLVAHEQFAVVVTYSDGRKLNYTCAEDESHEPVVWNCTKK